MKKKQKILRLLILLFESCLGFFFSPFLFSPSGEYVVN